MAVGTDPPEDLWVDDEAGPIVRPYAMTGGRTRPKGQFDLVALVVATQGASAAAASMDPEHAAIMTICQSAQSVAEISAHLDLPLGIVRVLLGDLRERGLIMVRDLKQTTQLPSENVLKAVLSGLRSL